MEGFSSSSNADAVELIVVTADYAHDTSCDGYLGKLASNGDRYTGQYNSEEQLLIFTIPAPTVRMKLCLMRPIFSFYTDVTSLGQIPVPTKPEKITAAEARCSLAPKGDCVIGLYPDPGTVDQPYVSHDS